MIDAEYDLEIDCVGCGLCAIKCPNNAISMQKNYEGFSYPHVDSNLCNSCGGCYNLCPKYNNNKNEYQQKVFAVWNLDDDIRKSSSSGGVFTAFASHVLKSGGVVVGAAFDDNLVVKHIIVDSFRDLYKLRGSKYVQSEITSELYYNIETKLNKGMIVLFVGTPCQVYAIKLFLGDIHENLITCDIVCHGVPSPLLFNKHINFLSTEIGDITGINFRDKTHGWVNYNIKYNINGSNDLINKANEDFYMIAFLKNYSLRTSCYNCEFTTLERCGDITLGDFWAVDKKYPKYDKENKGTSLVLVNTKCGMELLDVCSGGLFIAEADSDTAIFGNLMLSKPADKPDERDSFYKDLNNIEYDKVIEKYNLHKMNKGRHVISKIISKFKYTVGGMR